MVTTFARMLERRGTAAQWAANSTLVLADGELGVETNTGRIKVGDGATQYGALNYIGHDQGIVFASDAEVLAGTVDNRAIAPNTLADNYPRRAAAAIESNINNIWAFNNSVEFKGITTVILAPRAGVIGVEDVVNRAYTDSLFAGQISGGSGDVNKAPVLNSSGQLDTSFISSAALPSFRGTFNPTTGSPTLQNIAGGGISPVANNGDYFLASVSGFYNFDTGTPGAGETVTQGAQIVWIDATTIWSVINPPGTSFDPGAVRKTPSNVGESTIQSSVDAVVNLTLQNRTSQTVSLLQFLDNLGGVIGSVGADASAVLTSLIAEVSTSPATGGADYPLGLTHQYVLASSGWPIDGVLTTLKASDVDVYQLIQNEVSLETRRFTGTWSAWAAFAVLDSPTLAGVPTTPTATDDTDTDQIASTSFVINNRSHPGITECRLSTSSTTGEYLDVSADKSVTALSLHPYNGNIISLYDGANFRWVNREIDTIKTISTLGTINLPHDLFAYWTGSAVALEEVAWTNDTLRAVALTELNGVLVKSSDFTRKYIGSYYLDGTTVDTDISQERDFSIAANDAVHWSLYNFYNQIDHEVIIRIKSSTTNVLTVVQTVWTNLLDIKYHYMAGIGAENSFQLTHYAFGSLSVAGVVALVSVGLNGVYTPSSHIESYTGSIAALAVLQSSLVGGWRGARFGHNTYDPTIISVNNNWSYFLRSTGGSDDTIGAWLTASIKV